MPARALRRCAALAGSDLDLRQKKMNARKGIKTDIVVLVPEPDFKVRRR